MRISSWPSSFSFARQRGLLPSRKLQPPSKAESAGPRARDLGVPFEGTPGPLDAITDVPNIEVGIPP